MPRPGQGPQIVGAGDPVVDGVASPATVPGYRSIGSGPRQAAPGQVAAGDALVKTASAFTPNARVVTDTATVTWDWSTPGQAKANAAGGSGPTKAYVANTVALRGYF